MFSTFAQKKIRSSQKELVLIFRLCLNWVARSTGAATSDFISPRSLSQRDRRPRELNIEYRMAIWRSEKNPG